MTAARVIIGILFLILAITAGSGPIDYQSHASEVSVTATR